MISGSGLIAVQKLPVSLHELVRSSRVMGYTRVSSNEQNPAMQIDVLTASGLPKNRILMDYDSGMIINRHDYQVLVKLITGDKLDYVAVYRVDRLGRDQYELISFLKLTEEHNCGIFSMCEPFALHWRESSWAFRAMWEAIGDARYELLRLKERQRQGIDTQQDLIRRGLRTRSMGRPRKSGPDKK